jgi:hypothetical protein
MSYFERRISIQFEQVLDHVPDGHYKALTQVICTGLTLVSLFKTWIFFLIASLILPDTIDIDLQRNKSRSEL